MAGNRSVLSLLCTSVSVAGVCLLSACGSIPFPPAINDQALVVEALPVPIPEVSVTHEPVVAKSDAAPVVEIASAVVPKGNANSYWRKAVLALQNGKIEQAREQIELSLVVDANYKRALDLRLQLDADPEQVLGSESFEYSIQKGDTLSKLAMDYLNDPLKFYILARYNGLSHPNHIMVGQKIRMPGGRSQDAELLVADSHFQDAKKTYARGDYHAVIRLLEGSTDELGVTRQELQAISELMFKSYMQLASAYMQDKNFEQTERMLQKARALRPGSKEVVLRIDKLDQLVLIEDLYEKGLAAFTSDKFEEAFLTFEEVLSIDPSHREARRKRAYVKQEIVARLYRKALLAQRGQNLTDAVLIWDQFLALQPDNEIAKAHRTRAIELQRNLDQFAANN